MTNSITQELVTGFLIGSLGASTLSVTAERFGSKIGGTLGGIPGTIIVSLFLLGKAAGLETTVRAAAAIPALMSALTIFVCLYCSFARRGLLFAMGLALAGWAAAAAVPIFLLKPNLWQSLLIFSLCFPSASFYLERVIDVPSQHGAAFSFRPRQIVMRMLIGGTIVSSAVAAGAFGGPFLGALIATVPAVTLATLVLTYLGRGPELSAAVARTLLLNGILNGSVYATLIVLLAPRLGLIWATATAVVMTLLLAATVFQFVTRRAR